MALIDWGDIHKWLQVPQEVAQDVDNGLNPTLAEREVRRLVTSSEYDNIASNKASGDDKYDRLAQAEALLAFAEYIGNRGSIRLSEKGGLVRDLGIVNQQQTIRQLLSQGEVEDVQGRLRQQARDVLDELIDASGTVWAV